MADGGRGLRTCTSIPQSLFLLIHLGYPWRRWEDALEDHTHPALATKDQLADLKADLVEVRGTVRLMVWVMGAGFTALLALHGALIAILENE